MNARPDGVDRRVASPRTPTAVLSQLLGDPGSVPSAPDRGRRAEDRDLAFVGSAIAQLVAEVSDYAMLILDRHGHVSSWNRGAERIKGYVADEVIGQHFSVFYPDDDVAAGRCSELLRTAELEGRAEHEGWRVRRDGSMFWANVVVTALRAADGELIGFGKVTRDLTERRRHEQHLEHLATHDALSDLANRRAFTTALHRHLARPPASAVARTRGALLLVDLDHFKSVNDSLGHAEGDELIQATATILRCCLAGRPGLPARIGGDEFALLLPAAEPIEAESVAGAVVGAVRAWSGERYGTDGPHVTASVGVCPLGPDDRTADAAMARADAALYAAKRAGRDRVVVADHVAE